MRQLKLNFGDNTLSDHYLAYKVLDKGKNKLCSWLDSLSEDNQKISYNEFIYNTKECHQLTGQEHKQPFHPSYY